MEKADLEAMEAMMDNIDAMSQFDTSTYESWDFFNIATLIRTLRWRT